PPPRGNVQYHSGDERAERPGDRPPRRPGANRWAALPLGKRADDDRQRTRCQERAGDPLDRPKRDQQPDRRRQRTEQRRRAETGYPEREHPTLSEDVAQRPAEQD